MQKSKKYVLSGLILSLFLSLTLGPKSLATTTHELPVVEVEQTQLAEEWLAEVKEEAKKIGEKEKLYPSVLLAEGLVKSNFATQRVAKEPYYNAYELEAKDDEEGVSLSVTKTQESGALEHSLTKFKRYDSPKASLIDYVSHLKATVDAKEKLWRNNSKTYKEVTDFLGEQLNDQAYGELLAEIITVYDLTQYDELPKPKKKPAKKKIVKDDPKKYAQPLASYQVTSEFGGREHPIYGSFDGHNGIDLAADAGTEVKAAKAGVVVAAGFDNSAGNYVIVQHDDQLFTSYFHLESIGTTAGNELKKGETLGTVGSTGDSTGPHLHFAFSTALWRGYLEPREYVTF